MTTSTSTVVLVHGAFADAASWSGDIGNCSVTASR